MPVTQTQSRFCNRRGSEVNQVFASSFRTFPGTHRCPRVQNTILLSLPTSAPKQKNTTAHEYSWHGLIVSPQARGEAGAAHRSIRERSGRRLVGMCSWVLELRAFRRGGCGAGSPGSHPGLVWHNWHTPEHGREAQVAFAEAHSPRRPTNRYESRLDGFQGAPARSTKRARPREKDAVPPPNSPTALQCCRAGEARDSRTLRTRTPYMLHLLCHFRLAL